MNKAYAFFCRAYQTVFRAALPILPYREPVQLDGLASIVPLLTEKEISSVLLVTDASVRALGLTGGLEDALKAASVACAVYDKTVPNPTIANIEEGRALYLSAHAQAIIAVGGGSVMDCAKIIGARIAKPRQPVQRMGGLLRILRRTPLLIAAPTTAGTGSETTLAAVITDSAAHHKYPINDFALIPDYAVLDPALTRGLPPMLTATTGMDALTHAIEGYITKGAWEMSDMFHLEAIRLISSNLRDAVNNDPDGRKGMALGQYIAGMGFSNVGLGIAHSMAHTLGAVYDTPHGVACAMMLPIVMEYNADCTGEKYREIARAMGVEGVDSMTQAEYRKAAIDAVKKLSKDVGIPEKLEALKEKDLPFLAESAYADACCPGNPKDTTPAELTELFRKLM